MKQEYNLADLFVDYYGEPTKYDREHEIPEIDTNFLTQVTGYKLPIQQSPEEQPEEETPVTRRKLIPEGMHYMEIEQMNPDLRRSIDNWLGINYRYGGNSKTGIDCSAFTYNVYKDLGITIPRGSIEQYRQTDRVELDNLKVGDLVFLKGTQKGRASNLPSHVGLVTDVSRIADGIIGVAQAGSTGTKSKEMTWDLNKDFYRRHYLGAGRIRS